MAKNVQTDPKTGLLAYRRVYPAKLRPFVPGAARELKRSLRSKSLSDPQASRIYSEAQAEFERVVKLAKLKAAASTGGVTEDHTADPLFPELITFLADHYYAAELRRDEAEAWGKASKPTPYPLRDNPQRDWEVSRELLEQRKPEKLWSYWRDWTLSYCAGMGYKVSLRDPLLGDLLRAIAEAACRLWLALDSRIDEQIGQGTAIDTPSAPARPLRSMWSTSFHAPAAKGPSETLPELMERILKATTGRQVRPTTVQGWRTAMRFWTEVHGPIGWQDITRAQVTEFLELVSQRPARIPRNQDNLPLRKLAEFYADRPEIKRITGKTVLQHLSFLSAAWTRSESKGWIEGKPNPFAKHEVIVEHKAGGNPPTPEELAMVFNLPVFVSGERPKRGRGEAAFWIPLFSICTGARPEEIAQLIVSDFRKDDGGRWFMTFTDEGDHPTGVPRRLKTSEHGTGRRTFPIPQPLIDLGLPNYLAWLKAGKQEALFPLLTASTKGLYRSFGDWWGLYVRHHNALGKDKRPMRELRHVFPTQARAHGVAEGALSYLLGHSIANAPTTARYGDRSPLGLEILKIEDFGTPLGHIPRWTAPPLDN